MDQGEWQRLVCRLAPGIASFTPGECTAPVAYMCAWMLGR